MESRECAWCGTPINLLRSHARHCSPKCRVYYNRASKILPHELTSRPRWIRHTAAKVPITVAGRTTDATDPGSWSTFPAARESTAGAGMGFVLNGDGLACYDLDHCLIAGKPTDAARAFLAAHESFYTEVSPSGGGLHVWTMAEAQKGYRRTVDGLHVEFYTQGRYITITGNRYREAP